MRVSILLSSLMLACSGDGATTTDSGLDATTTPSWQDMDFNTRATYMADVVMPTLQPEFEAYDDRFATFTCETCHGSGAVDGSFSMPSDALFPIDASAPPTGPGADFMMDTVTPIMIDLLDAEPFDPTTGGGFGCGGCHIVQ